MDMTDPQIAPFDPTKKKKKQKQKSKVGIHRHSDDSLHCFVDRVDHGVDDEEDGAVPQSKYPWEGSEQGYQYKELLMRLFSFMHKNNPECAGNRRRTLIRPPQVLSDGTTETIIENFMDLCKTMHRSPEHVKAYMLKEIGTFGSLDGDNRLVLEGRFASTSFEDFLQRYIDEYVLCSCCRSPDTILAKERQILLLQCEMCGSERAVLPVDSAYVTRVGHKKIQALLR